LINELLVAIDNALEERASFLTRPLNVISCPEHWPNRDRVLAVSHDLLQSPDEETNDRYWFNDSVVEVGANLWE
jgi:hypothetical protein